MAAFIKEDVDAILAQTCPGVYADVIVAAVPSPEDLRRWIKSMNKTVNLVVAVDSVYNRHPGLRRKDSAFKKLMEELRLVPERSRRVFGMIRVPLPGKSVRGAHTYMLRRRYVAGTHKFGKGSVLTESKRHRLWRERHAELAAKKRAEAIESKMQRVSALLDRRSHKKWPHNAITAQDVQNHGIVYKPDKASALLSDMKASGKLISKQCRVVFKPGIFCS